MDRFKDNQGYKCWFLNGYAWISIGYFKEKLKVTNGYLWIQKFGFEWISMDIFRICQGITRRLPMDIQKRYPKISISYPFHIQIF